MGDGSGGRPRGGHVAGAGMANKRHHSMGVGGADAMRLDHHPGGCGGKLPLPMLAPGVVRKPPARGGADMAGAAFGGGQGDAPGAEGPAKRCANGGHAG